jgi:hypothetical protein
MANIHNPAVLVAAAADGNGHLERFIWDSRPATYIAIAAHCDWTPQAIRLLQAIRVDALL